VGRFFEYKFMQYNKQPLSLADQINILKQRGLIFGDEQKALTVLNYISYFRLASYWRVMEVNSHPHIFRQGSRFESVLELYNFDMELRALVFNAIQHIEIAARTKINQHFAMTYGAFWFMDATLAANPGLYQKNLDTLKTELNRSHDDFILEHFRKYDSPDFPPSWKTLEVASFGTLSKLYKNMNNFNVMKRVARDFDMPQHEYLRSWLESLTVVRNCCAHHARLWNAHFPVRPKMNPRMRQKWIIDFSFPDDRLYPQLCCIAYWLNSINPANTFVKDFKALLAKYPTVNPLQMGFTRGWQNEPLWQ
jgi:abortive infection bacteriophage resistance protein